MYLLLILFFTSFFGTVFIIGRKIFLIRNGQAVVLKESLLEIPHIENIKYLAVKNIKKIGHKILVETIRLYVQTINLLKDKYEEIKIKIKTINTKRDKHGNGVEKVEVSKFLKMMSEYKYKIRTIKEMIHEEEEEKKM